MRYYPIFVDLADQPCIVLGDGHFATEKAAALREAGAAVRVIQSGEYRDGDLAGARLVIDASEQTDVNRRSWREAEAAGILINVVDRPEQCRFIAPAIVRRDPLLIAISTSGEGPFLAAELRARLERWLGWEWGPFTLLIGRVRRWLRKRGVPIDEQTKVYRRLIRSNVLDLLRACQCQEAAARTAFLARTDLAHDGQVALVGAGPGDPDLITVRGRAMLAAADYVLHDALISPKILSWCGPHTNIESVGKRAGVAGTHQRDITARMIALARAGHFVVRLKGGDPFVFGRGGEELGELTAAGVDVVVVPGITSAFAAPGAAGIPVTMRGVASSVAITTAQGGASLMRLRSLALASDTLIVMMSRSNLEEVAAVIAGAVGKSRPAALVSKATWPDERIVYAPLVDIASRADREGIEAPATLIVGDVVGAPSRMASDAFAYVNTYLVDDAL